MQLKKTLLCLIKHTFLCFKYTLFCFYYVYNVHKLIFLVRFTPVNITKPPLILINTKLNVQPSSFLLKKVLFTALVF